MSRTWLIPSLLLFTFCLLHGAQDNTAAVEFFKTLRQKTLENLPENFIGELSGPSIADKLKTIPKEYLTNGSPRVDISWDRKKGFSIEVKNVTSYFSDMYQDYSRFLNFAVAIPGQSNQVLMSRYDISFDNAEGATKILRLAVKGAEDATLLYVNSSSWQIMRMDNVRGKQILISTIMAYVPLEMKGKTWQVIGRFFVKRFQPQETRAEAFEIRNISSR